MNLEPVERSEEMHRRIAPLLGSVLLIGGCSDMGEGRMSTLSVALEDQIARLEQLGVRLRPGLGTEDLLLSWDRAEYEAQPFELLLIAMGGEVEREPFPRTSDDVWHFDTEFVEDQGAYVAIAERVRDLSGGQLTLSNLGDDVDRDANTAWLAFSVGQRQYRWDLEVDDDWVDPRVFVELDQVLDEHASGLRLIYYDLGGQDCLLLVGDSGRLERLRAETGLEFVWLNE